MTAMWSQERTRRGDVHGKRWEADADLLAGETGPGDR